MNKRAVRNVTIRGLTLIIAGEVLGIISSVATFYSFFSWLVWFSFAAVACFILEFIGFMILRNGNVYFRRASIIVLLSLLLSIASTVLGGFFPENQICLSLSAIFDALIVFINIMVVMLTISGCRYAVEGSTEGEYGKTTSYMYTGAVVISVVLTLLTEMKLLTDPTVIGVIASIGTAFYVIAAVLFIILLFRTVGHLKQQAAAAAAQNK